MRALLVIVSVTTALGVTRGDEPLPARHILTAVSPNGGIRAISDPNNGTRIEDVKHSKVLWRLPDWHRSMRVADDGKYLVTESDGMNLIPLDFTDDFILLTFWREGARIREIRVRDLFPGHRGLLRTVSHYGWRQTLDFDSNGRLRVSLLDGRTLFFDSTTGNFIGGGQSPERPTAATSGK